MRLVDPITMQDTQNNPDLIMGTLNVLRYFAKVIIDSGANHLVIPHSFSQKTQPYSTLIRCDLES